MSLVVVVQLLLPFHIPLGLFFIILSHAEDRLMCLWCNDETGTESALSVVVYYCCQWKRNLNLPAQPAVNQYFTGSVLWRDDTKTALREGGEGEGKKGRKRRIYLDIHWHTFPPKVRENKRQPLLPRLCRTPELCTPCSTCCSLLAFPAIALPQKKKSPAVIQRLHRQKLHFGINTMLDRRVMSPQWSISARTTREGTILDVPAKVFFHTVFRLLAKFDFIFSFLGSSE